MNLKISYGSLKKFKKNDPKTRFSPNFEGIIVKICWKLDQLKRFGRLRAAV